VKTPVKTSSKKSKKAVKTTGVVSGKKKFSLTRRQSIFAVSIMTLVLSLGGFFGWQKYQENQSGAAGCASYTYQLGNSGTCVKYIQQLANGISSTGSTISVNSSFGASTKTKIIAVQKKFGLSATGTVGSRSSTWSTLCWYSSNKTAAQSAGCWGTGTVLFVPELCSVARGKMDTDYRYCGVTSYYGTTLKYYINSYTDYKSLCNVAHAANTSVVWDTSIASHGKYGGLNEWGMCIKK